MFEFYLWQTAITAPRLTSFGSTVQSTCPQPICLVSVLLSLSLVSVLLYLHNSKVADKEYFCTPFPLKLVHDRATLMKYVAGTHLYTWVERDGVE